MAIKKRNPAATRESILSAAHELFTEKGCDGTSLSDIARLAGINKSLIHHYFGSKEELHIAVLRRSFPTYAKRLASYLRQAEAAEDRLVAGFRAYFRFMADTPEYVRMGLWISLFYGSDPVRTETARNAPREEPDPDTAYVTSVGRRFVSAIEEAQKAGRIRSDLPAAHILASLWCLTEHWHESRAHMGLRMGQDFLADGAMELFENTALEILLQGVRPR